jgi:hypothetical protein
MRVLSVGLETHDDKTAAYLYREPDIAELPGPFMIIPVDADAGHVAAMAQYLSRHEDAVIFVHETAMETLLQPSGDGFVEKAKARGVVVSTDADQTITCTSNDGTIRVEIRFPALTGELSGTEDAHQLLDMGSVLYREEITVD